MPNEFEDHLRPVYPTQNSTDSHGELSKPEATSSTSFQEQNVHASHQEIRNEEQPSQLQFPMRKKPLSKRVSNIFKTYLSSIWSSSWQKRRRKKRSRKSLASRSTISSLPFGLTSGKVYKYAAIGVFLLIIFSTLGLVGVFAWYTKDLPQPDKIVRTEGFATKITDRDDTLLYEIFSEEKRTPVAAEDIPQYFERSHNCN